MFVNHLVVGVDHANFGVNVLRLAIIFAKAVGGNQSDVIVLTGIGLGNVEGAICTAIIPED